MKEKKYLVLGTVILIVLLVFGVSYSFYKARIEGDTKSISLKTKGIYLLYKGDLNLVSEYIEPGWSVTKTFTIENQGSEIEKYNIYIKDLVNTFVTEGYLQYKITSSNGYNMSEYKDIPKAQSKTDTVLAYSVAINPKEEQEYTIELIYKDTEEDQSEDMGKILSGLLMIKEGSYPSLTYVMLRDNPTVSEKTDFDNGNVESTTETIYQTNKTEDGSTVYYYSGDTTNNWVKFGKETEIECTYYNEDSGKNMQVWYGIYNEETSYYKEVRKVASSDECVSTNVCLDYIYGPIIGLAEEECGKVGTWTTDKATVGNKVVKDIYWRIIRTNEDNSVRLLYSGTSHDTEEGYIGSSTYNSTYTDPMYAGYMYGTTGSLANNRTNTNDSTIKTFVDKWYEDTLLTSYDKYISKTAIYCNDRSVPNNDYSTSSNFYYGSYIRLNTDNNHLPVPTYKCGGDGTGGLFESVQALADKFSASAEGGGNGQLKYPIALMTADELSFAGGLAWSSNGPYMDRWSWYSVNSQGNSNSQGESITGYLWWWSLSPAVSTTVANYVWYVEGRMFNTGELSGDFRFISGVRPVISLSSCVGIKSGNGTPNAPYEVDYNGSCK